MGLITFYTYESLKLALGKYVCSTFCIHHVL